MITTPRVDLAQVSLAEIVLRGGNLADPRLRQHIQKQYARINGHYPDLAAGLSCLFRPGASFDDLARSGLYPNAELSLTLVQSLSDELSAIGCEPALYITPTFHYPDHHTLILLRNGVVELTLQDEALDALIRAMIIVKNPYRSRNPQGERLCAC